MTGARLDAPDIEEAVLGAAIADLELARHMGFELQAADFTGALRPTLYRVICEAAALNQEVSAGIVFAELDPDLVADSEIDQSTLETWAIDAPVADPAFFRSLCRKLVHYRVRRELRAGLREIALADPLKAAHDEHERARLAGIMETVQLNFGALVSNGSGPELKTVDLVEAASGEIEPPPWAITGWLCAGDICVLAGDSGLGKSWLLLDLAFALALGHAWLEALSPPADLEPQRVLYIDEEQNHRLVRHRIQKWSRGRKLKPQALEAAQIHYLVENAINLDDDHQFRRLQVEIDAFKPHWIFIDTLSKIHDREENSNSEMTALFARKIRPIAQRVGAGVVALHHYNKPSKERGDDSTVRLRGASSIKADLDELFTLEADQEGGGMVLRHDKSRWGPTSQSLKVELEDLNDGVVIYSTGKADDAMQAVLETLADAGVEGCYRKKIVKAISDEGGRAPGRSASRHLKELIQEKPPLIVKRKEGNQVRYWLATNAPIGLGFS